MVTNFTRENSACLKIGILTKKLAWKASDEFFPVGQASAVCRTTAIALEERKTNVSDASHDDSQYERGADVGSDTDGGSQDFMPL